MAEGDDLFDRLTPGQKATLRKAIAKNRRIQLAPGEAVVVGRKLMGVCGRCRSVIRLDKPLLGTFHICVP